MNISTKQLSRFYESDGEGRDDRSERVDEALSLPIKVGKHEGRAIVPPDDGRPDLQLGESAQYTHYPDNIMRPSAGEFLRDLAHSDMVGSPEDIANELDISVDSAEKTLSLHGVSIDSPESQDGSTTDEDVDGIRLPNGEVVPDPLVDEDPHRDKLILGSLITAGMSVDEIAAYLADQTDTDVSPFQVREACTEHGYLPSEDTDIDSPLAEVDMSERTAVRSDGVAVKHSGEDPVFDDDVKVV